MGKKVGAILFEWLFVNGGLAWLLAVVHETKSASLGKEADSEQVETGLPAGSQLSSPSAI